MDVQEAIYHAVPLIVLPVAFEQDANAERIERRARGLRLEITTLKDEQLKEAIHEIIENSMCVSYTLSSINRSYSELYYIISICNSNQTTKQHLDDLYLLFDAFFRYKINMKMASRIFKKGQVKPLDSTLWWIDNALQSSAADATCIKSLGIHENWFSRRSLDVYISIFFCLLSAITLLIIFMLTSGLSKPASLRNDSANKNK